MLFSREIGSAVPATTLDVARYAKPKESDDTVYLQDLLDRGIEIPDGVYHISDTLFVRRDNTVVRNCKFYMHVPKTSFSIQSFDNTFINCSFVFDTYAQHIGAFSCIELLRVEPLKNV